MLHQRVNSTVGFLEEKLAELLYPLLLLSGRVCSQVVHTLRRAHVQDKLVALYRLPAAHLQAVLEVYHTFGITEANGLGLAPVVLEADVPRR